LRHFSNLTIRLQFGKPPAAQVAGRPFPIRKRCFPEGRRARAAAGQRSFEGPGLALKSELHLPASQEST